MCAELVADFKCPRLVQIQASQLRSLCIVNYWRAKDSLNKAIAICNGLKEDDTIRRYRDHTVAMLAELEQVWEKRWAAEGRQPPKEEGMEDASILGGEKKRAKVDTKTKPSTA
ncbi:hypothetical protein LTR37_002280 [Vermiconidia calcicola]|uniref:Uncharacterized protein n=1 Tax=Vermiconidia calcicola TaxID=1690605 RepID=A0ACC3NT74_9PEZI|nr:hypothetical protein LTR37_002280 [Vermiconidia calcicola]